MKNAKNEKKHDVKNKYDNTRGGYYFVNLSIFVTVQLQWHMQVIAELVW